MAYVDRILGRNERVLYRTRLHWVIFVWPLLFLLGALAARPWLDEFFTTSTPGLILVGLGVAWLGMTWLERIVEAHVVTNRRVISRWGIIRRDVYVYPLCRIDSIDVRQGLLGRLLGYGAVEIHTSAESHGTTGRRFISGPGEWRRHILEAIDNSTAGNACGIDEDDNVSAADRLRELELLLNEGLITREEYDSRRTEILNSL